MSNGPNLFARLHKWAAKKGQEENFFTESLAIVLEQLLILSPQAGVRLLSRLTDKFINLAPSDSSNIDVKAQAQVEEEKKKPDLEIRIRQQLAWIEVKVNAPLREEQLKNYLDLLKKSGKQTRMVLLTRDPVDVQEEVDRHIVKFRWLEFADWLENELPAIDGVNEVAGFLALQFLDFLKERSMALTRVGKYLPEGVRALSDLLNMLSTAATDCGIPASRYAGKASIGINLDEKKYWVGLTYEEPEKLLFYAYYLCPDEAVTDAAKRLCIPWDKEKWNGKEFYRLIVCVVELDSEPVHFFSRTKISQLEWLERFLREHWKTARSIKIPHQQPIPEESEES